MTLAEKQALLHATIALPSANEWLLSGKVVYELNDMLLTALSDIEASPRTYGEIKMRLDGRVNSICRNNPDLDIDNSEVRETIALFFALNHDVAIYHFLRYE